jgi:nanoRNase/pAp phosphatase (c-di-AMP/oligoRNAs hydrolase)
VHVLSKGTNVHSASEVETMERMVEASSIERVIVLDQGSRPGKIVGNLPDGGSALLLIDHHQSAEVGLHGTDF